MKNNATFTSSALILIALGLGFSSCKEDEPPVPPKLSFAESTMTVSEGDGVIQVQLVLDKPYGKDLNVEYTLGGTASDQAAVGTAGADYEIIGNHGVVLIPSGQTSGVIEIEIYSDAGFEEDETIEISIADINTSDVQLTADDKIVITITNDDAQLIASFVNTTLTVNEADGPALIQIAVQLDKPAPSDIIVEYSLPEVAEFAATDSVSAWNSDPNLRRPYDYYIHTAPELAGKLVIPAGATTASIGLQIVSDFYFEDNEMIEIELIESGSVAVGTNNVMTITIEQENGKIIALLWDPTYTDVDMDMFLFFIDPDHESPVFPDDIFALSINPSTEFKEEVIFLPAVFSQAVETEVAFGLSYVYYEGTEDPMNFEVHFIDFIDGDFEPAADRNTFAAAYTAANLNQWDKETGNDPIIVQTFKIVGGAYMDLSGITVPAAGSRMRTGILPDGLQRGKYSSSKRLDL